MVTLTVASELPSTAYALIHLHNVAFSIAFIVAPAMHASNDTIYSGPGEEARRASDALRLTAAGASPSVWERPPWMARGGLSYHDRADRWLRGGRLKSVARGQEFVADVGRRKVPREWLARVLDEIRAS